MEKDNNLENNLDDNKNEDLDINEGVSLDKPEENLEKTDELGSYEISDSLSQKEVEKEVKEEKKEEYKSEVHREEKEKAKKEKKRNTSYFIVALVAAIIGGIVSQMVAPIFMKEVNQQEQIVINPKDEMGVVQAVAKTNMKSVVGITTVEIVSDYYFFLPREVEGVGSGVIVDSDGYILTNSHVVGSGNTKSLDVLFEDGEKVPGKVLWNDPSLDLAMVKVEKTGLPAAKLGDSDKLEVGEEAIAIGNPLGLDFQRSVTAGIISGLNRTIKVENTTMSNLIQTDASINKGNSGGPLFNSKGEVIGINTVKVGDAEGLGFSIPINDAKNIIEEVIKTGSYEPVTLGVSVINSDEFASAFGVENMEKDTIIIMEVVKNSPADKAGLTQFDAIKKIGKTEVKNRQELNSEIRKHQKGDSTTVTVIRNGEEIELKVKF